MNDTDMLPGSSSQKIYGLYGEAEFRNLGIAQDMGLNILMLEKSVGVHKMEGQLKIVVRFLNPLDIGYSSQAETLSTK